MARISYDESRSRYFLPTFTVKSVKYPGVVTLEAIPLRGKLKQWLRGVDRPLEWSPSGPPTWEDFKSMRHYRAPNGIVSTTGFLREVFSGEASCAQITSETELRRIWEDRAQTEGRTEVSSKNHSYAWYLPQDSDTGDAGMHFCWLWRAAEVVREDKHSITIKFQPSFLAQLRHFFSLKPWDMTIYAPQSAH